MYVKIKDLGFYTDVLLWLVMDLYEHTLFQLSIGFTKQNPEMVQQERPTCSVCCQEIKRF